MPTSRTDTRVKCPFYQYDESYNKSDQHRITCEGLVECSTLVLNYRYKRDWRIQLETFCCCYFDRCEVYRMLMNKYEEDNI
jgi:hypothetical protein